MKRFEYELVVNIKKRGKVQVDAHSEEEAYEKLMNTLDSYEEDIYYFPTESVDIEADSYEIIKEE